MLQCTFYHLLFYGIYLTCNAAWSTVHSLFGSVAGSMTDYIMEGLASKNNLVLLIRKWFGLTDKSAVATVRLTSRTGTQLIFLTITNKKWEGTPHGCISHSYTANSYKAKTQEALTGRPCKELTDAVTFIIPIKTGTSGYQNTAQNSWSVVCDPYEIPSLKHFSSMDIPSCVFITQYIQFLDTTAYLWSCKTVWKTNMKINHNTMPEKLFWYDIDHPWFESTLKCFVSTHSSLDFITLLARVLQPLWQASYNHGVKKHVPKMCPRIHIKQSSSQEELTKQWYFGQVNTIYYDIYVSDQHILYIVR